MNWRDEWKALGARIEGLLQAGDFFVRTLRISSEDPYRVADNHLGRHACEIVDQLSAFLSSHGASMPPGAAAGLKRFLDGYALVMKDPGIKELAGLKLRLTCLAALRAEVEYHLSDFEAVAARRAERAFVHLRQSIVSDETLRQRWERAFDLGEIACEKLGATHLMLHGIWAFKVDAKGGRTDLVLGESLSDGRTVAGVADALILTEWKVVRAASQAHADAKSARLQIEQYTCGVLAGIELSRWRYVVLVSREQVPEMDDVEIGSAKCRHINVPVSPLTPSEFARR
jgi:hypothetical protein